MFVLFHHDRQIYDLNVDLKSLTFQIYLFMYLLLIKSWNLWYQLVEEAMEIAFRSFTLRAIYAYLPAVLLHAFLSFKVWGRMLCGMISISWFPWSSSNMSALLMLAFIVVLCSIQNIFYYLKNYLPKESLYQKYLDLGLIRYFRDKLGISFSKLIRLMWCFLFYYS